MNWTALGVVCAVVAFPVLLIMVGLLRSESRYRATKPAEPHPSLHPTVRRQPDDLIRDLRAQDPLALAYGLAAAVKPTYREVPVGELEARANAVPDWLACGACPPAHLPVSPDPRPKES